MTIRKMKEDDPSLKLEEGLPHAVWARNVEISRLGFSPYQIILGKSQFLPGITEGTILSDEPRSVDDWVRRHFQNQEKARIELRKNNANTMLREALRAKIPPYHDVTFEARDLIIVLNKDDGLEVLAKEIAREASTLHILYNGHVRKVAMC